MVRITVAARLVPTQCSSVSTPPSRLMVIPWPGSAWRFLLNAFAGQRVVVVAQPVDRKLEFRALLHNRTILSTKPSTFSAFGRPQLARKKNNVSGHVRRLTRPVRCLSVSTVPPTAVRRYKQTVELSRFTPTRPRLSTSVSGAYIRISTFLLVRSREATCSSAR